MHRLNVKTIPSQPIQFSISTHFSYIWPIDRTLSGATTSGQSGPGSDGNEGVLCIPQSSSITGTSPSDCFVSYLGKSWWVEVLLLCREGVGVFYSHSQLSNWKPKETCCLSDSGERPLLYSHNHSHNTYTSENIVNNNDELQWTNEHTSV